MACSSCAERRAALAKIARATAAGGKGQVKAQAAAIGRSIRRDLGRLTKALTRS